MNRPWMTSVFLLAAIAVLMITGAPRFFASPTTQAQTLQIPCRDPRGCPDLVPDQAKLAAQWFADFLQFDNDDCAVVEGCNQAGARLLLRFTYNTANLGAGDLIIGDPTAPENQPFYEVAECHRHLHFQEYADYRLWTLSGYSAWQALRAANPGALSSTLLQANPAVAAQMLVGRKQGFCVIDLLPANTAGSGQLRPGQPKYVSCARNQGISNGYADEYIFLLDCQWIDVTDVRAGNYILELEANPERLFVESNYANNFAAVEVQVPDHPGRAGKGKNASLQLKKFKPYDGGCGGCSTQAIPAAQ